MIRYNPKSWFGLIFQFHRSDTFRQMFWVLLAVAVYSFIVVYLQLHFQERFGFKSSTTIHTLLGIVIGFLLVFRTNTAYDRWWEGRKQWGELVNNTRNFSMKLNAVLPDNDRSTRQYFRLMIPNYAFALKEHLRKGVKFEELDFRDEINADKIKNANHVPNVIARDMFGKIHSLYKDGTISGDQLIVLDKEISSFTDILGACERIRNTPIPYSYNTFLKKFIFVYILTMPFGLAIDFKYWTIHIVAFVLYVFGSLELLAEEIEDPFGNDANDLPTDDLAMKIKINVLELLQS